jgi:hypothetical protein
LRGALLVALLGACVPDGKPPMFTSLIRGAIGGPCDADDDCKSGSCQTTSFTGYRAGAPGGYCSDECSEDSDCTPGKCVFGGDGNQYCVARCQKPSHCRDDYICDALEGYCEPAALYNLSCDPKVADCITSAGLLGGCVRAALGDGDVGYCSRACTLDGSLPCGSGQGCHLFDVRAIGGAFQNDAFRSLLCFNNTETPPVSLGGSCILITDCVSGADCVTFTDRFGDVSTTCLQSCNSGLGCINGNPCQDYTRANPNFGFCPP